jgi:hypothetical protein
MGSGHPQRSAVHWFALAVAALALSGLLAIVLVLGHVPAVVSAGLLDPELARRSLVVHVNLATGVWFFAFIVGLGCLELRAWPRRQPLVGIVLATAGVIAFSMVGLARSGVVLSDYVPVIDHPLFLTGLAVFAAGVLVEMVRFVRTATFAHVLPPEVAHGVRASGVAFVIAMLTFAVACAQCDPTATRAAAFQHVFWGGGHVLQFAAVAGMLAAWLLLFRELTGTRAVSSRRAAMLFALLVAPTMSAPWLVVTGQSPGAFTRMMELGIFPIVFVLIGAGVVSARRHGRPSEGHWPVQRIAAVGLFVSIAMTLLGFALGAAITGDTTLTPAHYHISIGAVTVSFMATLLVLLPRLGAAIRWPRLAIWQPLLYGGGQTVFALGLAIAGFWGSAARKRYVAEQVVSLPMERIGWIVAAVGGLIALVGGVSFIVLVLGSTRGARRRLTSL